MRVFSDIEQGTPEWAALRVGIPTASQLSKVITPKTRKPSSQRESFIDELLAERLMKHPAGFDGTGFTDRGIALEAEARAWYELVADQDVERVGFVMHDRLDFGCSPDGLVGESGGVEFKCPSPKVHAGYLRRPSQLVGAHELQAQGCMLATGRLWWDLVSYHPEMPPVVVRVERDEDLMRTLERELSDLLESLRLSASAIKGEPVFAHAAEAYREAVQEALDA